jgi:urea transport system permease protein
MLLGLTFVAVTLFFPKGIGGLFDLIPRKGDRR